MEISLSNKMLKGMGIKEVEKLITECKKDGMNTELQRPNRFYNNLSLIRDLLT